MLLAGLEYLINISYVDDTEVFKVLVLTYFVTFYCCKIVLIFDLCFTYKISYTFSVYHGVQVCLDYWNSLVSELFDSKHNLDSPAGTATMMGLAGLQVEFQALF